MKTEYCMRLENSQLFVTLAGLTHSDTLRLKVAKPVDAPHMTSKEFIDEIKDLPGMDWLEDFDAEDFEVISEV